MPEINQEQEEAKMSELLTTAANTFRTLMETDLPACRSNDELTEALVSAYMMGFTTGLSLYSCTVNSVRG